MVQQCYTCETCGYTTKVKCNYIKHVNRKRTCEHKEQIRCDGCNALILSRNWNKHVEHCKGVPVNLCLFCKKEFKTRSGKCKHQKRCSKTPVQSESESVNITINITNNNIFLNFGQEDVRYLLNSSKPEIQNAIRSIVDSIDLVHFNKDHPENQTVRKLNKKSNTIEFRTGQDRWEHECCKTGIPKLRHNLKEHLKVTFDDNARFTDPDLRELLYYKSIRGCVDVSDILVKHETEDANWMQCRDKCDDIKNDFFKTVSPAIQRMPCVVQDLQRQLNDIRCKHRQSALSMNEVIEYAFKQSP